MVNLGEVDDGQCERARDEELTGRVNTRDEKLKFLLAQEEDIAVFSDPDQHFHGDRALRLLLLSHDSIGLAAESDGHVECVSLDTRGLV
eukprot:CAMPEP_0116889862 /NCGR_PEP_ID=MMETSP0467-20121206/417_1 /TAXON_ID=283647 /ORGANISM="Mesodinium pulex, Strain SPMC105" /LENGTH=88 /DNA_ID=CAMNT_0004557079 /DNA_START=278 /DNA_END=544 /DNA_ORIENTATION=+